MVVFITTRHHPRSSLFPYTTLFRSRWSSDRSSSLSSAVKAGWAFRGCACTPTNVRAQTRMSSPATANVFHDSRTPWLDSIGRSEEHTSELQSRLQLVCRLLLEKKKK